MDDKKKASPLAIFVFAVLLLLGGFGLYKFIIWLMLNAFGRNIPLP